MHLPYIDSLKKHLLSLPKIFWISAILTFSLLVIGLINPKVFAGNVQSINIFIFDLFGTYFMWYIALSLLIFLGIGFSPLGKLRLGGKNAKPVYSAFSWFSMLFCAGMAVGLIFNGPVEPLYHYMNPPVAGAATSFEKEVEAFKLTFLHWGIHPWGIYGLTTLAVSFFALNNKKDLYFSSFLFNKSCGSKRYLAQFIDLATILAILFGVVASFGMGVLQIEGGIAKVFNIKSSILLEVIIIAVSTVLYMISTLRGLSNGIRILSNFSMFLSFILLIIIGFHVPFHKLFNLFSVAFPAYIQAIPDLSIGHVAFKSNDFLREWTIKYRTYATSSKTS